MGDETNGELDVVESEKESGKSKKMFDLILSQPNEASAFINIAWCLTQDCWDYIREKQMKFPFFLIIISRISMRDGEEYEEDYERRLVPLHQGLETVEFFQAGEFKIYAYIVYDENAEKAKLPRGKMRRNCVNQLAHYLEKRNDVRGKEYNCYFLNGEFVEPRLPLEDGTAIGPWTKSPQEGKKVAVEEHLFATDPPVWLAWWVDLWFPERSKDICHLKKRAIWAFSGQLILEPVFRLLVMAFRWLYFVLAVLVGHRIRDWRPLCLPYGYPFTRINGVYRKEDFMEEDNFWWITDNERNLRGFWYPGLLLAPFVWALVAVVAALKSGATFWQVAVGWVLFYLSVKIIVAIVSLIVSDLTDKLSAHRVAAARDKSWLDDYYDNQLRPLACDNYQPRYADISELPATHRTFRLRFWSWKSNLCKPFQKK